MSQKRAEHIEWAEYFMAVASLSALRSKDPSTQVGACIVSQDKKIVGIGYNGMPLGCSDDVLPWGKAESNWLNTKYPYVCHAEMNAIMNRNSSDVKGCTMYTVLFPCNECAKLIIQSGIKHVVFLSDKNAHKPEYEASRRLLDLAGVSVELFRTERSEIKLSFNVPGSYIETMQQQNQENQNDGAKSKESLVEKTFSTLSLKN